MKPAQRNRRVALFALSILVAAFVLGWLGLQLYRLHQDYLVANARVAGISAPEDLERKAREGRLTFAFYAAGVAFAFSVTLYSRWVVWQDVRRETEIAQRRERFVVAVSHQLRTPLTAIQMYADTLALGRVTDERKKQEYLETISRESRRLAAMVEHALRYARSDNPAAKPYAPKPIELGSAVEKVLARLEPRIASLRVEFEKRGDPVVFADPAALEHVLENLLSNVAKYVPDLRARVEVFEEAGGAVLRVSDNGPGIPVPEREQVFEEFYRAPRGGASPEGMGLGLSLVRRVVEVHNGEIAISDNQPTGAVFTIRLPKHVAS